MAGLSKFGALFNINHLSFHQVTFPLVPGFSASTAPEDADVPPVRLGAVPGSLVSLWLQSTAAPGVVHVWCWQGLRLQG